MADQPDIMTVKEVAALYRFDVETVRRWVRMGRLKPMRLGNQMRFKRSVVIRAMDSYEYGDDGRNRDPSMG